MEKGESVDNLSHVSCSFDFIELLIWLSPEFLVEFTVGSVFLHEIHEVFVVEETVQLQNVRMVEVRLYLYLILKVVLALILY